MASRSIVPIPSAKRCIVLLFKFVILVCIISSKRLQQQPSFLRGFAVERGTLKLASIYHTRARATAPLFPSLSGGIPASRLPSHSIRGLSHCFSVLPLLL
jgi:hypothetical protein